MQQGSCSIRSISIAVFTMNFYQSVTLASVKLLIEGLNEVTVGQGQDLEF
ncbi:hypothetical protein SAMN05421739_102215 [Pontibacter chinhatensis]|uniref:Uncharacterized protein n=1 Tax=Pontibacter chinhatensis TaxID=1436961 RepID=A0A1I2R1L2_9BACT|nr:hypothetical protein SAMN05421739_102215 [Pontibacter chinhatensis]